MQMAWLIVKDIKLIVQDETAWLTVKDGLASFWRWRGSLLEMVWLTVGDRVAPARVSLVAWLPRRRWRGSLVA